MSAITTHVLDTAKGRPAAGVPVQLQRLADDGHWEDLAAATTDVDGRVREFPMAQRPLIAGMYRLNFDTARYFGLDATESFFPAVHITFEVRDATQHHHVPLLLSPFGYSTYRGS